MKIINQICIFIIFSFFCQSTVCQQNCKVLKSELAGSYKGKCKNGLADGKGLANGTDTYKGHFIKGLPDGEGTYTWATGESYTGQWREGKRNGAGKYTFSYQVKDSTITGIWENDSYKGREPAKPRVIYKSSVDRYRFEKTAGIRRRVLISIYQNGVRNTGVSNLMTNSSSGYETKLGNSIGYDEVSFPVTIKVTYTTLNKLKTTSVFVEFEFEISDPGDWTVDLHN